MSGDADTVREALEFVFDSDLDRSLALDTLAALARLEACAAQRDALAKALEQADLEASVAHDAVWSKEVTAATIGGTGIGVLHDSERNDSANAAIWRLHEVVRAALAEAATRKETT